MLKIKRIRTGSELGVTFSATTSSEYALRMGTQLLALSFHFLHMSFVPFVLCILGVYRMGPLSIRLWALWVGLCHPHINIISDTWFSFFAYRRCSIYACWLDVQLQVLWGILLTSSIIHQGPQGPKQISVWGLCCSLFHVLCSLNWVKWSRAIRKTQIGFRGLFGWSGIPEKNK